MSHEIERQANGWFQRHVTGKLADLEADVQANGRRIERLTAAITERNLAVESRLSRIEVNAGRRAALVSSIGGALAIVMALGVALLVG